MGIGLLRVRATQPDTLHAKRVIHLDWAILDLPFQGACLNTIKPQRGEFRIAQGKFALANVALGRCRKNMSTRFPFKSMGYVLKLGSGDFSY